MAHLAHTYVIEFMGIYLILKSPFLQLAQRIKMSKTGTF